MYRNNNKQYQNSKTNLSTPNVHYHPLNCEYTMCFYSNSDDFFIYDTEDYELIKEYCWHQHIDKKGNKRPRAWINGKNIYFSRFIMNTPKELECDHLNGMPEDNRKCNLRNCTHPENLDNRKVGQGKIHKNNDNTYSIVGCSHADKLKKYVTYEDAAKALVEIWDSNPFSYKSSQEKAAEIETHRFKEVIYLGGILEKINNLPQKHYMKVWLSNINCWRAEGNLSEENEARLLSKLIDEYKAEYQDAITMDDVPQIQ